MTAPWENNAIKPAAVPYVYLAHFAFPVLESWLDGLRNCGAEPLLYYGNDVLSLRAASLDVIRNCPTAAPYLSWVEP